MARTQVLATLKRIRRQLHSGHRSEVNLLSTGIDATTPTVVLQLTPGASVIAGAVLSVDLELMRITAVVGSTVTVLRGWLDSTAATHDAVAEVMVNPRFALLDVYEAMIAEIDSWGPQLYRIETAELSIVDQEAVELPAEFISMYGLCRVQRKQDAAASHWPSHDVRLVRGGVGWTGASTSGLLLRLVNPVESGTLFVSAAMPIVAGEPALTDDLVDDVLVPASLLDVLEMGVKLRLVQDGEWARTARQAQDDSRRTAEVPPGSTVQPMQFGVAMYRNRRQEEVNKLRAQYPIRVV